jgi:hypothetical protein
MLAPVTAGAGAPGLSDVIYRQLVVDRRDTIEECGSPTAPRPTPSASTSPAARSRQAAPPSRPAPRPASKHSSRSTGKTTGSPASEIPAASSRLHRDLLEEAEIIS